MGNLYRVDDKKEYKIVEIPDSDMLESIGIIPGSIIWKEYTYGFGGPAYIKFGTRNIAIGKDIAKFVRVEEV